MPNAERKDSATKNPLPKGFGTANQRSNQRTVMYSVSKKNLDFGGYLEHILRLFFHLAGEPVENALRNVLEVVTQALVATGYTA